MRHTLASLFLELSFVCPSPLFVLQQHIRMYHSFIRLFDMPPIFFSKADSPKCPHAYRDYSYTRSKIHELVVMMKKKKLAGDDCCNHEDELVDLNISFVLTEALQVLHPHYNANATANDSTQSYALSLACHNVKDQVVPLLQRIDTYETELLSNTTSMEALDVKNPAFQGLLSCIEALGGSGTSMPCSWLSMVGACQFLEDMLRFDGVQEAISEAGGWKDVQGLAALLIKHGMVVDFDESSSSSCETITNAAHFSLLQDVPLLLQGVTQFLADFSDTQRLVEAKLQHLWDTFECGTCYHTMCSPTALSLFFISLLTLFVPPFLCCLVFY
jgi:hypothetical protein